MRAGARARATLLLLWSGSAAAAELTVLSSNGASALIAALAPRFERSTGHHLVIQYDTSQQLSQRILAGADFDVAILTREMASDLSKAGRSGPGIDIARSGIGVAVPAGAALPDITSIAGLKSALLTARSIGFSSTGASGHYIETLLQQMGIAQRVEAKSVRRPSDELAGLLDTGRIDLLLQQISEISTIKGARFVGPLPAQIQLYTTFTAVVATHDAHASEANALVALLSGPDAIPLLKAARMEMP